jgi:hypothetical protein
VTSGDLVLSWSSPRIKRLPWADLGFCEKTLRALRKQQDRACQVGICHAHINQVEEIE